MIGFVFLSLSLSHRRLEKEYTVIRKDEQEEQIEIRVCARLFALLDIICLFIEIKKRESTTQTTRRELGKSSSLPIEIIHHHLRSF